MCFNMSYESYIKSILIILAVLAIYFSGSNIRTLILFGLTLNMIGTIFLVIGSADSLNPLSWKDKQPPSLKRDYKHLFEKNYGLILEGQNPKDIDFLENTIAIQAKYPVLRLKAAEFGPWVLLIGFVLQFCAARLDP